MVHLTAPLGQYSTPKITCRDTVFHIAQTEAGRMAFIQDWATAAEDKTWISPQAA